MQRDGGGEGKRKTAIELRERERELSFQLVYNRMIIMESQVSSSNNFTALF